MPDLGIHLKHDARRIQAARMAFEVKPQASIDEDDESNHLENIRWGFTRVMK
jgi:hypothetical protein